METVETLHYKWCLWTNPKNESNLDEYILMEANAFPSQEIPRIRGDILVYCKVERFNEDLHSNIKEKVVLSRIRTVPVKREEMEKI